jgi:hypothetical protein
MDRPGGCTARLFLAYLVSTLYHLGLLYCASIPRYLDTTHTSQALRGQHSGSFFALFFSRRFGGSSLPSERFLGGFDFFLLGLVRVCYVCDVWIVAVAVVCKGFYCYHAGLADCGLWIGLRDELGLGWANGWMDS